MQEVINSPHIKPYSLQTRFAKNGTIIRTAAAVQTTRHQEAYFYVSTHRAAHKVPPCVLP